MDLETTEPSRAQNWNPVDTTLLSFERIKYYEQLRKRSMLEINSLRIGKPRTFHRSMSELRLQTRQESVHDSLSEIRNRLETLKNKRNLESHRRSDENSLQRHSSLYELYERNSQMDAEPGEKRITSFDTIRRSSKVTSRSTTSLAYTNNYLANRKKLRQLRQHSSSVDLYSSDSQQCNPQYEDMDQGRNDYLNRSSSMHRTYSMASLPAYYEDPSFVDEDIMNTYHLWECQSEIMHNGLTSQVSEANVDTDGNVFEVDSLDSQSNHDSLLSTVSTQQSYNSSDRNDVFMEYLDSMNKSKNPVYPHSNRSADTRSTGQSDDGSITVEDDFLENFRKEKERILMMGRKSSLSFLDEETSIPSRFRFSDTDSVQDKLRKVREMIGRSQSASEVYEQKSTSNQYQQSGGQLEPAYERCHPYQQPHTSDESHDPYQQVDAMNMQSGNTALLSKVKSVCDSNFIDTQITNMANSNNHYQGMGMRSKADYEEETLEEKLQRTKNLLMLAKKEMHGERSHDSFNNKLVGIRQHLASGNDYAINLIDENVASLHEDVNSSFTSTSLSSLSDHFSDKSDRDTLLVDPNTDCSVRYNDCNEEVTLTLLDVGHGTDSGEFSMMSDNMSCFTHLSTSTISSPDRSVDAPITSNTVVQGSFATGDHYVGSVCKHNSSMRVLPDLKTSQDSGSSVTDEMEQSLNVKTSQDLFPPIVPDCSYLSDSDLDMTLFEYEENDREKSNIQSISHKAFDSKIMALPFSNSATVGVKYISNQVDDVSSVMSECDGHSFYSSIDPYCEIPDVHECQTYSTKDLSDNSLSDIDLELFADEVTSNCRQNCQIQSVNTTTPRSPICQQFMFNSSETCNSRDQFDGQIVMNLEDYCEKDFLFVKSPSSCDLAYDNDLTTKDGDQEPLLSIEDRTTVISSYTPAKDTIICQPSASSKSVIQDKISKSEMHFYIGTSDGAKTSKIIPIDLGIGDAFNTTRYSDKNRSDFQKSIPIYRDAYKSKAIEKDFTETCETILTEEEMTTNEKMRDKLVESSVKMSTFGPINNLVSETPEGTEGNHGSSEGYYKVISYFGNVMLKQSKKLNMDNIRRRNFVIKSLQENNGPTENSCAIFAADNSSSNSLNIAHVDINIADDGQISDRQKRCAQDDSDVAYSDDHDANKPPECVQPQRTYKQYFNGLKHSKSTGGLNLKDLSWRFDNVDEDKTGGDSQKSALSKETQDIVTSNSVDGSNSSCDLFSKISTMSCDISPNGLDSGCKRASLKSSSLNCALQVNINQHSINNYSSQMNICSKENIQPNHSQVNKEVQTIKQEGRYKMDLMPELLNTDNCQKQTSQTSDLGAGRLSIRTSACDNTSRKTSDIFYEQTMKDQFSQQIDSRLLWQENARDVTGGDYIRITRSVDRLSVDNHRTTSAETRYVSSSDSVKTSSVKLQSAISTGAISPQCSTAKTSLEASQETDNDNKMESESNDEREEIKHLENKALVSSIKKQYQREMISASKDSIYDDEGNKVISESETAGYKTKLQRPNAFSFLRSNIFIQNDLKSNTQDREPNGKALSANGQAENSINSQGSHEARNGYSSLVCAFRRSLQKESRKSRYKSLLENNLLTDETQQFTNVEATSPFIQRLKTLASPVFQKSKLCKYLEDSQHNEIISAKETKSLNLSFDYALDDYVNVSLINPDKEEDILLKGAGIRNLVNDEGEALGADGTEIVKSRVHLTSWDPAKLLHELYSVRLEDETAEDLSHRFISMEGYMEKLPLNKKKATLLKTWKRRFFQTKDGWIHYYERSRNDKPSESFELMGGQVEGMGQRVIGVDDGRGHYLMVRCPTLEEYEQWMTALTSQTTDNTRAAYVRPTLNPSPHPNKTVVIVDIGSSAIRAGLLGEKPSLPRVFLPSLVGVDKSTGQLYIGADAYKPEARQNATLSHPFSASHTVDKFTVNREVTTALFEKIFSDLGVNSSHCLVMLSMPQNYGDKVRSDLMNLLIDGLHTRGVCMVQQSLLALYSYKATSGIIVDVGERLQILPIYDGYVIDGGVTQLSYGGGKVSETLKAALTQYRFYTPVEQLLVRYVKEQTCFVVKDYKESAKRCEQDPESFRSTVYINNFDLPEGTHMSVSHDYSCFHCTEGLFDADMWGMDYKSLHKLVHKAIQACPMDSRRHMCRSIYLSGGATCLPGFADRLQHEITKLVPSSLVVVVHASPHRYHAAYIGASTLAALDVFEQSCILREEWKTQGAKAFRKWKTTSC